MDLLGACCTMSGIRPNPLLGMVVTFTHATGHVVIQFPALCRIDSFATCPPAYLDGFHVRVPSHEQVLAWLNQ